MLAEFSLIIRLQNPIHEFLFLNSFFLGLWASSYSFIIFFGISRRANKLTSLQSFCALNILCKSSMNFPCELFSTELIISHLLCFNLEHFSHEFFSFDYASHRCCIILFPLLLHVLFFIFIRLSIFITLILAIFSSLAHHQSWTFEGRRVERLFLLTL
jgi:hypothetical protein